MAILIASVLLCNNNGVMAVNNGLGLTPAMGYNTWVKSTSSPACLLIF
jgi:hypothetical protein